MSQVRRDRVAFLPPLGVSALVTSLADGPVQFVAQRLRPITRFSLKRGGGTPGRESRSVLRDATRRVVQIATIDIDRDPWWIHFRRRR